MSGRGVFLFMADNDNLKIESCPDPNKIKDCQDCIEKGLAKCSQAKEYGI